MREERWKVLWFLGSGQTGLWLKKRSRDLGNVSTAGILQLEYAGESPGLAI
jgi:hypothetical protein